jgi:hypothetical protein
VHIFTDSKLPWVNLEGCGKPTFKEYYQREHVWAKESLERRKKCLASDEMEAKVQQDEEPKVAEDGKGETGTKGGKVGGFKDGDEEGGKGFEEITKGTEEVKL